MKLQLDTTKKTLKLEGEVVISELIEALEKMFPDKEWKKYKLITETQINNFTYPVYLPVQKPYYYWENPWYVSCQTTNNTKNLTDSSDYTLKDGIYNVEITA